jgi:hypothetical protein
MMEDLVDVKSSQGQTGEVTYVVPQYVISAGSQCRCCIVRQNYDAFPQVL